MTNYMVRGWRTSLNGDYRPFGFFVDGENYDAILKHVEKTVDSQNEEFGYTNSRYEIWEMKFSTDGKSGV